MYNIQVVRCFYEGENPMIYYFDGYTYRAAYLRDDGNCPLSSTQIEHYLTQLAIWDKPVPITNGAGAGAGAGVPKYETGLVV